MTEEVKFSEKKQKAIDRMKKIAPKIGNVRVEPTKEEYRVLKHPSGVGFRSSGSSNWPNDNFTKRRIAEGSLKAVESQTSTESQTPTPSTTES